MDDRRARAEAIEDFAAALRELRESVGNPSFREMSGRSGAISHTTLHEATKGNRLPSWETTVEFVKACDADPAAYREHWERASRVVKSAIPVTVPASPLVEEPEPSPAPAYSPTPRGRLTRPVVIAAVAVTLAAGVVVAVVVNRGSAGPSASQTPSQAADCPVRSANPPAAPAAHEGDAAAFIADVTLPDCSHVGGGTTVTKVWRFRNAGTVAWKGYALHRVEPTGRPDQCQTDADVPIADARPGETVDVKTVITTPDKPGLCYVRFKMVDAAGAVAFPGKRPVNFQVIVD